MFDWDKDEAHRFLGSLKVSLEELVCAEEGVTDKEFDLVDDEGDRGIASISLRFTYRSVASIGEATVLPCTGRPCSHCVEAAFLLHGLNLGHLSCCSGCTVFGKQIGKQ